MEETEYEMKDFDSIVSAFNWTYWELARACFFGNFNPTHKKIMINREGNLISWN